MARTYAQAQTERLRLLALGQKLEVRVIKNPIKGDDGAIYPGGGAATNDFMLEIKDPRGSSQGNATTAVSQEDAIAANRWHDAASTAEHQIRIQGMLTGAQIGGAVHLKGWGLYGAGETREGGAIANSAAVFT